MCTADDGPALADANHFRRAAGVCCRHRFTERECLRRGARRRMVSNPAVLDASDDGGEPRDGQGKPARGNPFRALPPGSTPHNS
jgi:hypothetical protein